MGLNFSDSDPVWSDYKKIIITGGVRAGKTTRGGFKAFKESLNPKVTLIWLVGPDYVQAREEFRMIFEWCNELGLIARGEDGKLKYSMPQDGSRSLTTITGCRIETKSAKHPETLASVAPDGIVLCEPGQMPEEAYNACIGRLIQKRGWLWAVGTLENETNKPRYAWFEDKAVEWDRHPSEDQVAFSLPTWANTTIFPDGEADPVFVAAKKELSSYLYMRKYGGKPLGVDSPVFPWLWEDDAWQQFVQPLSGDPTFVDGAIGVDYGRTYNHPSAVVVVHVDDIGRYWVRAAWQGYQADLSEIESVVHGYEQAFNIHVGTVDPNQGILADALGYNVAAGGSTMGKPSEMRFSLANGLLESNSLFFEEGAFGIDELWKSMRLCARYPNSAGELVYMRPIGDDLAQALMYAIEHLRGSVMYTPQFDNGNISLGPTRLTPTRGNAGRI